MGKLFGTDGIRGQANTHPVIPEIALQLGKAIAHVFEATGHGSKRVVIGKDTRLSGYMLETALTSGLVSMGMDVFLVGPVPTPAVAHLTKSMAATAGIMLTASHNPYDDNGIKIFDQDGFKLSDETEVLIESYVPDGHLKNDHIRTANLGKAYRIEDARGRYIEFAKSTADNHRLEGLRIVLDCANGAAYRIGPWIFEELGADVIKANTHPDGYNINQDCGALHPENVAGRVAEEQADLGIAFDGDADRVIFTDDRGNVIDGDRILAMCARDLHARGDLKDDTLVVTTMSNLGLHKAMNAAGIKVVTTAVGDRYVIDEMRRHNYNLGGEKSGHVILMDHATTGDGIITALQVLRLMKESGKSIRVLAQCMDEYPQKLVSIRVTEKRPLEELPGVQKTLKACEEDLQDRGRAVLRYSGTEPKLRLLVEAREQPDVDKWTERLTNTIQTELGA